MKRRALTAALVIAGALACASQALAGIAEVRDADGHLVANAGRGSFASVQDSGWTLRFDAASRSVRGVSLEGVSMAGGLVYADHVFVPAHGLRGARVQGLMVNGRPGTQLLVGLARAARPASPHLDTRLAWLALGVAGHGEDIGYGDHAFPEQALLGAPGGGTTGERAVRIAEQYLGVPYRWGGADPIGGFDCSGLTMYVYAQLGIGLAHYTGSQFYEGMRVPPSRLLPGDLLFFEPSARGPQHEGIYIGGGQFIHAPHTGDVVKISSLAEPGYAFGFVGAVRPWAA